MIKDPLALYYIGFPLGLLVLMIVFLTRKEIKSLFWFCLIWGTGLTTVIVFILEDILGLIKYQHGYPFIILNLPLFFDLAWTPATMIFLHFLPRPNIKYAYYTYIILFALLSALNDDFFHQVGLLKYIHWSPIVRFLLSLPYFYWLTVHYLKLKSQGVFEGV